MLKICRYLGQINPTDFFTRLLAGVEFTGLAPASFYQDPNGPDRHFDGMCAARLRVMHDMCVSTARSCPFLHLPLPLCSLSCGLYKSSTLL